MRRKILIFGISILCLTQLIAFPLAESTARDHTLTDKDLTDRALSEAHSAGLIGLLIAQKSVRMSLSEWNELINADLGTDAAKFRLTSDIPVFVLVIKGNVEWKAPGLPKPGQNAPERYDNTTVVLNANNRELLWIGAYHPNQPMPVPLP